MSRTTQVELTRQSTTEASDPNNYMMFQLLTRILDLAKRIATREQGLVVHETPLLLSVIDTSVKRARILGLATRIATREQG